MYSTDLEKQQHNKTTNNETKQEKQQHQLTKYYVIILIGLKVAYCCLVNVVGHSVHQLKGLVGMCHINSGIVTL